MSIISSEADHLYPPKAVDYHDDAIMIPVYTSDDLAEAYMQGAERQPTDEEIEAGAKALYSFIPDSISWDEISRERLRQKYREMARATWQAMQGKATEDA